MYKFDEIQVGLTAEIKHTITSADIRKFSELTGDDNRLHMDADFAATTSLKKPVAHGMLGASFISTIIGTKLPGDGALWFSQNLEFLLPVHIGDTLTIKAEVIKKDNRQKVIELSTDIFNQHRQKVTKGFAKVKLLEPAQDTSAYKAEDRPKKVALVVGASGGIGAEASRVLASAGFAIAVHYYKNSDAACALAAEIDAGGGKARTWGCDVTDYVAVSEMVDSIVRWAGPISVLVNCTTVKIAAIKFSDLVWSDFQLHINNQILGAFNLARAVTPLMEKMSYGKVIFINSQALETPSSDWLPYITAKGALLGFSRALAYDLAPKGIRVNMVSPGMTDTDLIGDIPERVRLVTAAKTPLKRIANPHDVANAILFLASHQSDFLCGETIRINGGQVMI